MADEFLWRKQVLPLGKVSGRGRELDFTPAYLADIAAALTGGAFDLVPLVAEDPRWGMTGDPALWCGDVRALEAVLDGMDALVAVSAETDARLAAEPALPVAARLVEHYRTSDGREFPVALMSLHVCSTPALTGLRPWKRES